MKTRNLHPLLMIGALALTTAGCQANDSYAGNDEDSSQYAGSDADYSGGNDGQYNDGSDQGNAPSQSAGMRTVNVMDQSSGQPVRAAAVTVPANWQTQGGVSWNRSVPCAGNQMRYQWQASSPDGSQAFSLMPGMSWQVQGTQNQMNPCPVAPFRSTQDFLTGFVQQQRSGARIIQYRPNPSQSSGEQQIGQGSSRTDAGEMLIGYQNNGQEFREVISASVTFTQVQGNLVGGASNVTSLRAPDGQLDFDLASSINQSMMVDREWMAQSGRVTLKSVDAYAAQQSNDIATWHNGRMGQINRQGDADRAAIRRNSAQEVAGIYGQIQANTSATNDEIHRQNLEGIGGYNTYYDPAGGNTVQADINYNSVVRENDGSYTGTNDPYYNPAGSNELERVQ